MSKVPYPTSKPLIEQARTSLLLKYSGLTSSRQKQHWALLAASHEPVGASNTRWNDILNVPVSRNIISTNFEQNWRKSFLDQVKSSK